MTARNTQHGFSLIELMVAMILGLVVSFAALNIYTAGSASVRTQDGDAKLTEAGTFVLATLTRHIRNAGFVDWTGSPTLQGLLVNGIDFDSYLLSSDTGKDLLSIAAASQVFQTDPASPYTNIQSIHGCSAYYSKLAQLTNPACAAVADPTLSVSHTITLATQVRQTADALPTSILPSVYSKIPVTFDPVIVQAGDCADRDTNSSNANPRGFVAVNRFYLADNIIYCFGNADPNSVVTIATNVEQMVFRYGQAQTTIPPGQTTTSYSGDQLVGSFNYANAVTAWPLVTAVEVCVVVVGEPGSRPVGQLGADNFLDCFDKNVAYTDNRLRRAMKTVVSLRNRFRATS